MAGRVTLVTFNYKELTNVLHVINTARAIKCIEHIVVIDNHSCDGSIEKLKELNELPYCTVLESKENGGYTKGFNQAIKYALNEFESDYVLVVNADVLFDANTIEKCIIAMDNNSDYGLISPRMLNFYKREECAAWHYPTFDRLLKYCFLSWRKKNELNIGYTLSEHEEKDVLEVDVVRSSFNFFKRDAIEKCGGYDENIFLFNCENLISKKLNEFGYKVGLLLNSHYVHNHKPGNVNVLFRMRCCLKENLYYAKKCLAINRLQDMLYRICAVIGFCEMKAVLMLLKWKHILCK